MREPSVVRQVLIHSSPPPHNSQAISVLLRQEDGGDGAVGLGDDPDPTRRDVVGAEDPITVAQRDLVLAAVEGAQLSPVPCSMAGQVLEGVRPYLREEFQGPRSGYYLPEGELGHHRPLLASKANLGGFKATFGP